MAKKKRTGDDERAGTGRAEERETGKTGPGQPAGAGDRPALTRQSLDRLRRKLKAKYH
jgi:hypothetical protein